ncbi:MAG: hypothetical protein ACQESP_12790 [Candidatus Muiribacteriota bacterium]
MRNNNTEKIKHLNERQVEELYSRYISGEKNKNLIAEYKIDISPNSLIKVFPAFKHEDCICPYCEEPMFSDRKSKTELISYGFSYKECYSCEHIVYDDNNFYQKTCNCLNCKKIRKIEEFNKLNVKRGCVYERYNPDKISPQLSSMLSCKEKIYLLCLLKNGADEGFNYINSLDFINAIAPLAPTPEMSKNIIEYLYETKKIIVEPFENELSVFDDISYKFIDIETVKWLSNIKFDDDKIYDNCKLFNFLYEDLQSLKHEDEEEIYNLIYEISIAEVIQYVEVKTDELNLPFSAQKKTREVVLKLLNDFSVSQIYYFVKKSVEDAHIFYSKGKSNGKKHASNIIPGKILDLGERALSENWEFKYKYRRDSRAPRSFLSRLLFDFVLHGDDDGFKKAPGKYWKNEIYPLYFKEPSSGEDLCCQECSSSNVKVSMAKESLTVECLKCGFLAFYDKSFLF